MLNSTELEILSLLKQNFIIKRSTPNSHQKGNKLQRFKTFSLGFKKTGHLKTDIDMWEMLKKSMINTLRISLGFDRWAVNTISPLYLVSFKDYVGAQYGHLLIRSISYRFDELNGAMTLELRYCPTRGLRKWRRTTGKL